MAEKGKAPSKNHKWDATKGRWVVKSFEERQKGRNILLQGKNNPIRIVHDTIRNVNAAKEVRRKAAEKANPPKEEPKKSNLKTKVSDHKDTGHTKLVKGKDGKVRRVKVSNTTKDKTLKGSDTSKMKGKDQGDGGRADWLKKTRNSPAAKSKNSRGKPTWTDEERWQQQLKHRAWKEGRKKKKSTPKPTQKSTTQKPEPKKSRLKFSDPLPEKKKKKKNNNNPIGLQFGR